MRLLLAGLIAVASAAHQSYGCVGDDFYDTGCVAMTPLGFHAVGMIVYGAADTDEAHTAGAGDGEGTLACVLGKVPGGPLEPYYSNLPGHLLALRPFMACRDVDTVSWFNNSAWGQEMGGTGTGAGETGISASYASGQVVRGQLEGESRGEACRRLSQEMIIYAADQNGSDFNDGVADTGMPFVAPCPRPGGYKGRGGTAEGYAVFQTKDSAAQCAAIKAAYKTNTCCSESASKPLMTPFSLPSGLAEPQTCASIKRSYQGKSCCPSARKK